MNINDIYPPMKKIEKKYKWNALCKNNSISITSILSLSTQEKPKMVIESYTSNNKQIKYREAIKQRLHNYTKIKNETENFIFNKVNMVYLSNDKSTSLDPIPIKNEANEYRSITSMKTQCSLIKKKSNESDVIPYTTVVNRNKTPLTSRNPLRRDNEYNTNKDEPKRKTHHRDVSAGLVYEQTNESHLNYINIDHMIMLEDKLLGILSSISKKNDSSIACHDWWSYYFNSSLCNECYEEFFNEDKACQVIIHTANNLELFAVLLYHFISIETETASSCSKFNMFLSSVFHYLHINYLLICKVIVEKSKMKIYSKQKRLWVNKVNDHLNHQLKPDKGEGDLNIALKIRQNCKIIVQDIKIILSHYTHIGIYDDIIDTFNSLTKLTNNDLNDFFREQIQNFGKENNTNTDTYNNDNDNDNVNSNNEPGIIPPFIHTKPIKPYTLVLDLDETLVSSKIINISSGKGKVKFRPGLIDFLTKLRNYYEIISFTASNKEYAEPVLNLIEKNGRLFDHRLYNPHTTIYQNKYIKNLTLIGRSLSTMIIIDNLESSYRLQRENGILIKPFQGDHANDRVLIDLLPILIKIAKTKGDVRQSLLKYKDEISTKVTLNKQ